MNQTITNINLKHFIGKYAYKYLDSFSVIWYQEVTN